MKTIFAILTVCFTLITAMIIYITRAGVSIRTAPIIKPSAVSQDFHNVPFGIFLRLFPDFQQADYVIFGFPQNSPEAQTTLNLLKERYEKEFKTEVKILAEEEPKNLASVQNCLKPCWIFLPEAEANELSPNAWIQNNIHPTKRSYFTLTWIPFQRKVTVSELCEKEKRLDLECLKTVSVKEVERKMKDPNARYFFMRKYLDHDYFLFVESESL